MCEQRLIDANAADVDRICCYHGGCCYLEDVQEWLDEQPTIDAVPVVHGRWEWKFQTYKTDNMTLSGTYPTCNLCGHAEIGVDKSTPYCPNCGAKMDGGNADG